MTARASAAVAAASLVAAPPRPVGELPADFRARAADLDAFNPGAATAFRACAIALEQALAAQASDVTRPALVRD